METITNAASAVTSTVSKTIWGEQTTSQNNETAGKEPISGEQGKGTVDEPFDQGNADDPTGTDATSKNTYIPKPDYQGNSGSTGSSDLTGASNTEQSKPNTNTSEPSLSSHAPNNQPNNPVNASQGGAPNPLKDTDKTGVTSGSRTGDATKASDIIPSNRSENPGAAPASSAADEHKQQSADKPLDAPKGDQEGAVKDTKEEGEELLKKRDPNDHSGEPMHLHDGSEKAKTPTTQAERRESKLGQEGGQEHGKEPKGTGEEWVKTSGLASDGGDFDATKPGAGKEADRLLEQKGIRKTDKGTQEVTDPDAAAASKKSETDHEEKVKLSQKIKDKLHIGSKH